MNNNDLLLYYYQELASINQNFCYTLEEFKDREDIKQDTKISHNLTSDSVDESYRKSFTCNSSIFPNYVRPIPKLNSLNEIDLSTSIISNPSLNSITNDFIFNNGIIQSRIARSSIKFRRRLRLIRRRLTKEPKELRKIRLE